MTKYFKRNWTETRGDEFDSWGTCIYYFEVDDEGIPTKQMELYENGNRLRYHIERIFDDYGKLGDQPLDLKEFGKYKIGKDEFESEWQ
ncbi:hypothetical protein [Flagellimonas myxillae]|uniref:hypothetical protein n=1 Tax=Flagellimonas myxillae TaxID=2942214 RepID=UPI00201F1926|nr:hypothetical protein [Muricauda myxillae]MCL6268164.1 hypothetical protein [Muricauda myxillae]